MEEWGAKIGAAYGEVEEAAGEYRVFLLRWLGVDAHDVDASLPPDALLKLWGTDLESLYGRSQDDSRLVPPFPDNDPSTAWNEQTIWAFTYLVPFEVRVSCEDSISSPDVYCLSDEMIKAWDRLVVLRTKLDDLNTPADIALATADNAVNKAQDSAALTAEQLADFLSPADPLLIRSKERELALAETALADVEAFLAGLRERLELGLALELPAAAPGTGEGIDTTMLDDVSESLRRELLAAQKEIEDALLDLWDAEESLETLYRTLGPRARGPERGAAGLRRAGSGGGVASSGGRDPDIAHNAGIVTGIAVRAREYVERGDPRHDRGRPHRGGVARRRGRDRRAQRSGRRSRQRPPARAAGPVHEPGTVSYVSPTANKQEGSVTFDVRIRLEAYPKVTGLRSGLTAVAELVLRLEPNVLLIPLQALRGRPPIEQTVLGWEDGVIAEKHVTTGSDDGVWVVVESGLSEGDAIVVEGSPSPDARRRSDGPVPPPTQRGAGTGPGPCPCEPSA